MPEDIIKPNQPQNPEEPEKKEPTLDIDEKTTDAVSTESTPETSETPSQSTQDLDITSDERTSSVNSLSQNPTSPFNPAAPTPPPSQPQAATPPQAPEPKRRGAKLWIIVLLIIVIAGASAAAALFVAKSGDKDQKSTTQTNAKKDIAHLRYALPDGDLSKFYPAGNTATSVQVNSQIFEGLVRYDQQTKIEPLLATDWSNSDTSTWTFNLRKDVKFHNGKPMTAKDVKYSLDYAVQHQEDEDSNAFLASSIKQIDVINDHQVKIMTDGPDPILLNRLAYLYVIDSEAKPGDPISGTGPYTVKSGTTPTETNLELAAVNSYYGGHIYTKALTITIVPSSDQMITEINDGKFDLAGSLEPDELAKVKSYEPIEGQNFSIGFIGLNTTKPNSPLSTKEGREAVAYALDTSKVLKAGNLGGDPTGQVVPPKIPGYDASIKATPYDPAKAKELLAKAPNPTMPLTLSYGGGEDNKAHMTEIANELKAAGFNVNLVEQPDLDTLVEKAFSGQVDMFYIVYDSPTLDGYDVFSSLLQGNDIYKNEDINTQIDDTMSIIEPSERLSLLKKISREVADEKPIIPLYVPTDVFALKKPYFIQTDIPGGQAGVYFWQTYQK